MKEYNRFMKNKKNQTIRSWIGVSACFLVLLIAFVSFLTKDDTQKRNITYTNIGFDTPIQFQATCTQEEFDTYSNIVKETFESQNHNFDAYDSHSVLYKLNQDKQAQINEDFLSCIHIAMQANQQLHTFDISQGALLQAWHSIRESEHPDLSIIEQNEFPYGMECIHLQEDHIELTHNIRLDLGGIAKGYTAQLCKEKLNKQGLHNGFINAGGNVVLLGEKPDKTPWNIGIQSPDDESSLVQVEIKKPLAMVTSGDYQRYATIENQRYGHIIDPNTKYPAKFSRSVTVLHEDSAWADAYSTALFCMSVEDGMKYCQEHNISAIWITETNDTDCFLKTKDYNIYATADLQNSIQLSQNFTK